MAFCRGRGAKRETATATAAARTTVVDSAAILHSTAENCSSADKERCGRCSCNVSSARSGAGVGEGVGGDM